MTEYRLFYDTAWDRGHSHQTFREPLPGPIERVHLGRVIKRSGGGFIVPVVAICSVDGRHVRKVKKVYINTRKLKNLRLTRVVKED